MTGLMPSGFVEATVMYRVADTDPRDPAGLSWEKRLFNLAAVALVTPSADGKGRSVFHMFPPASPPFFVVLEPYEYWSQILSSAQPRPVGPLANGANRTEFG